MYLFANSPTVDTIACKPTYPQSVAVSCGAFDRSTFLFVVILCWFYIEPFQRYVILTSRSSVSDFLLYIWIQSKEEVNLEYYWELLADKVMRAFWFALPRLDN